MLDLNFWIARIRLLGFVAIGISLATWAADIAGLVYACPYCRTQRTVIGVLGLFMILPNPGHWMCRYLGAVLAVFGLCVGSMQHFNGWKKVMDGTYAVPETWYLDAFILSGFALLIIVAQLLLLYAFSTETRRSSNTGDYRPELSGENLRQRVRA